MHIIRTLLLFTLILSASNSQARFNSCIDPDLYHGWSGGGAYSMIADTGSELYLSSDVAGLWKASKKAKYWSKINAGLQNLNVATIAIAPKNKQHIFAATAKGVFHSFDGGAHWNLIHPDARAIESYRGENYRSLTPHPIESNSLFIGDANGHVYHWTGTNLRKIISLNEQTPITAMTMTADGSTLILGTQNARYFYAIEADKWQLQQSTNKPIFDIVSLTENKRQLIIAAGQRSLSLSENSGQTWRELDLEKSLPKGALPFRLAAKRNDLKELSILIGWNSGWQTGLLLSDDSGKTWRDPTKKRYFSANNPTRRWKRGDFDRILSVSYDSYSPNTVYLTTHWGFWRSTDGGETWHESFISDAQNTVGSSLMYTADGDLYTASMDVGLIRYARESNYEAESLIPWGNSWREISKTAGHIWNIVHSQSRLIATSSAWGEETNRVLISEDGGKNWNIVTAGLPKTYARNNTVWELGYARALALDPFDSRNFYLGIDGVGLFKSTHDGYRWHQSDGVPPAASIYNALAIDPLIKGTIYWGSPNSGIYISIDDGKSWQLDGLSGRAVFDLAVTPNGTLYAGVQGINSQPEIHMKETRDGTWKLLHRFEGEGTVEAIAIHPTNPKIAAIGTNSWEQENFGQVYLTSDGGESWQRLASDLGPGASDMAFSPCSPVLSVLKYGGGLVHLEIPIFR